MRRAPLTPWRPPGIEGRKYGLVAPGCDPEEIDDWYLVLERLVKPSVVGSVRILPRKGILDRLVAVENLPMQFALGTVPVI
jgi:hypothetical protein